MKTIEERAKEYAPDPLDPDYILPAREEYIVKQQRQAYVAGAREQKEIDEAELLKLKSSLGKGSSITYNGEANYKQGYNDAIKKACNVFCYTGCPHKTDFYNCLNDKCDTWKIFRKKMEE